MPFPRCPFVRGRRSGFLLEVLLLAPASKQKGRVGAAMLLPRRTWLTTPGEKTKRRWAHDQPGDNAVLAVAAGASGTGQRARDAVGGRGTPRARSRRRAARI